MTMSHISFHPRLKGITPGFFIIPPLRNALFSTPSRVGLFNVPLKARSLTGRFSWKKHSPRYLFPDTLVLSISGKHKYYLQLPGENHVIFHILFLPHRASSTHPLPIGRFSNHINQILSSFPMERMTLNLTGFALNRTFRALTRGKGIIV